MPKFDDFDLDVKSTKVSASKDKNAKILSVSLCTPGTCWQTCGGQSTLISNCCLGSVACSLNSSCR
ncbi:MAG: gallidermin family lantibiotic [Lachnospiraceae bacterium]|nr:gallidermin family lantibiotic [Lachnospiraceae bacterium]